MTLALTPSFSDKPVLLIAKSAKSLSPFNLSEQNRIEEKFHWQIEVDFHQSLIPLIHHRMMY
jgi:hypothetical protein